MPNTVTLAEAKAALRVDFTDDDALIDLYIQAASDAVLTYLKSEGWASFWDGTSPTFSAEVPASIKAATLTWLDILYEYDLTDDPKIFPDGRDTMPNVGQPPRRVAALLYTRRDPALA